MYYDFFFINSTYAANATTVSLSSYIYKDRISKYVEQKLKQII